MRKWLIGGTIVIFLCVIAVLVLLNLNTLIERNRDRIIAQAEQALGRKVKVGEIGVSLWTGIGVRLNDFALSDDASFSKEDFVRARNLQINLELWPLLRRQIEIKRLILNLPKIGIIRNAQGNFNFSTIAKKDGAAKPAAGAPQPGEAAPLALLVNLIDISGGEVRYLDRKEGIDLRVRQIDVKVTDFNLNKPFTVSLAAAVFSERQNFKAQSQLGPVRAGADPNAIPLDGRFDLDPISLDQLKTALPAVRTALPKALGLRGVLRFKNMRVQGTLNKLAVNGSLDGTDAALDYGDTFK
ncbi:MAG TPA: AsmA family protein, partial [Candidatus Binatia bacterium]